MKIRTLVATSLLAGSLFSAKPARAYDMDCAIMLCMAGGFPSSAVCAAAYAEMIRRITPWPSRPPFGICTFVAAPVALGGSGGEEALDISTPDYVWLRRTRVLWWWSRHWESSREETEYWSWSLRSCDHENRNCRYLSRAFSSTSPWPDSFTSENGQVITPPTSGSWPTFSRAVMVEYGDYEGNIDHSDWQRY